MQHASTQFTGFTGRKAQILTLNMGQQREPVSQAPHKHLANYSVYKSTNPDAFTSTKVGILTDCDVCA